MTEAIIAAKTSGDGAATVAVELSAEQLAILDAWIAAQPAPPSRADAIRTLLRTVLPTPNTTTIRGEFG